MPLKVSDLEGKSFLIAVIEVDSQTGLTRYTNYITRTVNGTSYTVDGNNVQPTLTSAIQATTDSGGNFSELSAGKYTYTFGRALPEGYNSSATHVVGAYAYKSNRTDVSDATHTFVPDGSQVVVRRLISRTETCNTCHQPLALHGGVRQEFGLCVLCHTPQTTDPETGNTVDFKVMIHKIHNGAYLPSVENGTSYRIVGFGQNVLDFSVIKWPQDVRNCEKCHTGPQGDNYKLKPNRAACSSCHDDVNFGTGENHLGGVQTTDQLCTSCHTPDSPGVAPITEAHNIPPWPFEYSVSLNMTSPENGKYYTSGETPQVTVVIKNATSGEIVDPNTIANGTWSRANLYVSGPRDGTHPVLTTAALTGNYTFYAENDLRVNVTEVDPRITRFATDMKYQLADVSGLAPGTYTLFVEVKRGQELGGWELLNFQVGTSATEAYIATNCTDCHGDNRQHPEFFAVTYNTDTCKSCHDYTRQRPGELGWSFTGGWNGYGAAPIVKKVPGVHYGSSLNYPEDLVFPILRSQFNFSDTTFPQDVRNCQKCHSQSPLWKEKPSRLACLACHDSDAATTHAKIMTYDPTPVDPWSGDEVESCTVCHGPEKDFSPDGRHIGRQPAIISITSMLNPISAAVILIGSIAASGTSRSKRALLMRRIRNWKKLFRR